MKYLLGLKKLPFEQSEKQIIYVEGEYDEEVNHYIQKNYEHIAQKFDSWGYEFCYLPYLGKELAESESMHYYSPFAANDFKPSADFKSDLLLNWMVNPDNKKHIKPSLLYYHPCCFQSDYEGAESQYRGITLTPDSGYDSTNDLSTILKEIHYDICAYDRQIPRFHFVSQEDVEKFKSSLSEEERKEMELWESIAVKYRQRGVKRYLLATLAYGEDDELGPLQITKNFRIILTATGEEIKMGPLPKTLYLFFLNHEESIDYPHLVDYRNELRDIYMKLLGTSIVTDEIINSINDLVDYTNSNSINEKMRYIRVAFRKVMEDYIASNYYVDGEQGKPKGIKLPRNLVTWECDMVPPTQVKDVVGSHERIRHNW